MTTPVREIAPMTYQGLGTGTGQQLIPAGSGTVNVYNGDILNVLLVSPDRMPQLSNSIPIQPLTNGKIDASKRTYYGSALTGTIAAITVSAAELSPSPAQIATQINALGLMKDSTGLTINGTLGVPAQTSDIGILGGQVNNLHLAGHTIANEASITGIPTLRLKTNLNNGTPVIAGGATDTLLTAVAVSQLALQCLFALSTTGAPTNPFARIGVTWQDAGAGVAIDADEFFAPYGSGSDFSLYLPLWGDSVTVSIANLDPAASINATWSVTQTSHPFTGPRFLEWSPGTVTGFTRPAGLSNSGVLASTAPTIGPGATASRLIPVWAGRASINIDNFANANACLVTLTDPGSPALYASTAGASFGSFNVPATSVLPATEIRLPNGPVLLNMKNLGGAGNITPNVTITKTEN